MDKFKDKINNAMNEAKDKIVDIKDKMEDVKDKTESTLDDAKYIIVNSVEDAKLKAAKGFGDAEDKINELKKKF